MTRSPAAGHSPSATSSSAAGAPVADPTRDDAFVDELNELLVSTFHSIERYEEQSLRTFEGLNLSVNEAHVIEAVGHGTAEDDLPQDAAPRPRALTVSQVAASLGVRVPTATAAVNRLVAKNLLVKERSSSDGRSVLVRLTREGRRAFRLHALFHRRMADAVAGSMTAEERRVLLHGIRKLKAFFENAANGDTSGPRVVQNSATSIEVAPSGYPGQTTTAGTGAGRVADAAHGADLSDGTDDLKG